MTRHRPRRCPLTGKFSFPSPQHAYRAIRLILNRNHRQPQSGPLEAYKCADHWHIGHQ